MAPNSMRRILSTRIYLPLALAIIVVVGVAFSGLIAYRSVQAYGLNIGGRITYVGYCVIEDPVFEPNVCNTCLNCTAALGSACAGYNEILWTPAGGAPGQFYSCVPKAYLFQGGGKIPRIGGMMKSLMLAPQIPIHYGIGL